MSYIAWYMGLATVSPTFPLWHLASSRSFLVVRFMPPGSCSVLSFPDEVVVDIIAYCDWKDVLSIEQVIGCMSYRLSAADSDLHI